MGSKYTAQAQNRIIAIPVTHGSDFSTKIVSHTLFTPDTILRWHRQLVARKWDYSGRKEKKQGRPRIRQKIVDWTLQFARENPTWGFDRMQGELSKVGYQICDPTVANILKYHGIEPAPNRNRRGLG